MQACSYDRETTVIPNMHEDLEENYVEDKQQCYNGSEEHPEFTNSHCISKSSEKTLKGDLKKAGFPINIVAKADEIFSKMSCGMKRGSRKCQLMFFCVREAYNTLGIPEDPARLASMCGISRSEISKSLSMCAPSKTNYKAALVRYGPSDFIRVYYQKIIDLGVIEPSDNFLQSVEDICHEVLEVDTSLRDEKPQTVAAAILVFYLGILGYSVEKKKYNDIFNFSEMTIQKLRNKVSTAYNT